jgi:hypothetical protein
MAANSTCRPDCRTARARGEGESGAQHRRALTCQPGLVIHAGAGCVVVMGLKTAAAVSASL